jgi:hypothetical protein
MKKNFIQMFAACLRGFAILAIGGLTTTALISCGDDDDDNNSQPKTPQEQQEDTKAATADITLTLVIQPATLNVFEYDFKYVDAKGNTKTFDIDNNTTGVSFDEFERNRYNTFTNATFPVYGDDFYKDMQNPLVLRYTLKDQPTGKKYSYETVCHVREDFKYQDVFIYAFPCVFVTETPKGGQRTVKNDFQFQITKVTNWEPFANLANGKRSTLGSDELTVNE